MTPSTRDDNEATVRRLYEDCINPGRLELLEELVSPGYVGIYGESGPEGFANTIKSLRTGVPDVHFTLEFTISQGDRVAVRWRSVGTHTGPLRGFPPSNARITDTGISIYELEDGRIVRAWLETNRLGVLQQIGIVPSDEALRAAAAK